MDDRDIWPSLPLADWQDTHDTLHTWMQIVGKTQEAPQAFANAIVEVDGY
jgi:hypothetical protein